MYATVVAIEDGGFPRVIRLLEDEDGGEELDELLERGCALDKNWHALHYLLTGTAWQGDPPLNFLLVGQEPWDGDGANARYVSAERVRAIAATLPAAAGLRARFDASRLDELEIYPEIWRRDGAEALDWVVESYQDLCAYVRAAAEKGQALVTYIG